MEARSFYETLWNPNHPFQHRDIVGLPKKIDIVTFDGLPESKIKYSFLSLKIDSESKLNHVAFLLNPNNKPPIVEDVNAGLHEFGFPENIQIKTGGDSLSCIQLLFTQHSHSATACCNIKFLVGKDVCRLLQEQLCTRIDYLILLVFSYLEAIKFDGYVELDDDMRKDGKSVMLFRIMSHKKLPSKYQEYGFQFRNEKEVMKLVHAVQNPSAQTNVAMLEKQLQEEATQMYNTDFKESLAELRDKWDQCFQLSKSGGKKMKT